jgi:hypothetical protein
MSFKIAFPTGFTALFVPSDATRYASKAYCGSSSKRRLFRQNLPFDVDLPGGFDDVLIALLQGVDRSAATRLIHRAFVLPLWFTHTILKGGPGS